jgi:hypothetical protein
MKKLFGEGFMGGKVKKRKFRNKSFCMLESALIESEALKALPGKAALLCLIRFHQKAYKKRVSSKKRGMKDLVITNNREIIFTYREARELGIKSRSTFDRVIKELVKLGFIEVADPGNYYQRKPTKFSIVNYWIDYGTSAFEAEPKKRMLPKGLGFQPKNKK